MGPCPICGKANGTCGDQPLAYPPIDIPLTIPNLKGAMVADTKIYLPKQTVRRGVAGYRGKDVVVVDPATRKELSAAEDAQASKAKGSAKPAKGDEE